MFKKIIDIFTKWVKKGSKITEDEKSGVDKLNTLLLEQRNLFQTLLDIQQDIIIVLNDQSMYVCNRRFFEFFGSATIDLFYKKNGQLSKLFLNENDSIFGFENDTEFLSTLIRHRKSGRQSYVLMFDRHRGENRNFLVDYDYFPLIENGFVITLKDVTDNLRYKKALEEKNEAQKELLIEQSKLASVGEMIATIAHQWRQPINAINIIIQNLEDQALCEKVEIEDISKATEDILRQTNFMSQTIEDFRNFLRPDKEKRIFSAIETVSNIIAMLKSILKKSSIEVEFEYDGNQNYEIYGVRNEFGQVVLNIINNAKDAIEDKKIENGKISIKAGVVNNEVEIQIHDNGGGIPEQFLPNKIFQNHFSTKGEKGTGIGLHITKLIIEHNFRGRISVKNEEAGALFTIAISKNRD